MSFQGTVDVMPFWLIMMLAAAIVIGSIETGWRLGRQIQRKYGKKQDTSINIAVGAMLGLLSFLLAYTVGMATERFEHRNEMVVAEANAIGTVFLRTDFLPDGDRLEARRLVKEYTLLRSEGAEGILSPQGMEKSSSIQSQLWQITRRIVSSSDTLAVSLFTQSLNEMIDANGRRIASLRNNLPDTIWLMLILVNALSMASLGFEFGLGGSRRWFGICLLVIAFTCVILFIADLDRPQSGLIRVSQQPLLDLLAQIGKSMQ